MLAALGNREIEIPDHIDMYFLNREAPASNKTSLECVLDVDKERIKLEKLAEELVMCTDDGK